MGHRKVRRNQRRQVAVKSAPLVIGLRINMFRDVPVDLLVSAGRVPQSHRSFHDISCHAWIRLMMHRTNRPGVSNRRATTCGRPRPCSVSLRRWASMMDVMESTRVDRWLWAVRLTKTRPDAAAACRGGHVRVNDRPAKPSTMVSPGDEVRARVGDRTRIVEVARVIQKRVGAADAVTCYLDRTPAPPPTSSVPVAARDRGAGRPTKRDRRILDRWRAGQG